MNKYLEIRKTLDTFDIICCEHKDWFWNLIGHTAMVVRDKEKDLVMVWQSTTKYANQSGTSLSFFNEWLDQYPGKVYIRRMLMTMEHRVIAEKKLDNYIKLYRGKPYPNLKSVGGLLYMRNLVIDFLPWTENPVDLGQEDARSCADRIAHTERYCGIFTDKMNPSEQEPDNFRDYKPFHKPIDTYLTRGVILMPEVRIK